MKPNKKTSKANKSKLSLSVIGLLSLTILFLGYIAYNQDIFNIKSSNAKSRNYSKTYPAGDIVEKKPIKVLNYDDAEQENNNEDDYDRSIPQVNWRSFGKKIKLSTNSKGQKINGWRTRGSPIIPRMTYISKSFIIPKPVNTRNRPMAVQLCWKAKSWNTNVSIRLYREGTKSWYTTSNSSYDHRQESNNTARRLGCYGFNEYIYDTDDYGDPVNRQVKARMYVAVLGDPIDIAAIKVKSIPLPTGDFAHMRSDFKSGKFFGDGTNINK
jgi:hypothetical protein